MKTVVVLPGQAPHWAADHARHLAQRLTTVGRVMVIFTRGPRRASNLPGQPGNASVLGHSTSGYPIWTGRLSAALGLRRQSRVTVIVLWTGSNDLLALWIALVSRIRGEHVVLDVPEIDSSRRPIVRSLLRRTLCRLAGDVVEGTATPEDAGGPRTILAMCGDDMQFADLALQAFESMSDATAQRWRLLLQVSESTNDVAYGGSRRVGKVIILSGTPSEEIFQASDVLMAAYGRDYEELVHEAVLNGGAGVLVGQPVAGMVARCHDGVWLAKWDAASILVALEASSGDLFERPGTVSAMRELADDVIHVAEKVAVA
jgi:hypothetical protein